MPEIIDTIRFMEYGKPAPNNSEFKGLVTTDTVFGSREDGSYFSYTSRLNATESSFNDQITVNEDGFIGYTSRENAAGATTYSSIGVLDKEKIETFRKMGRKAFSKKGDLLWDAVIALESFESAHKHNLFHTADYAAAISKVLPQFFKKVGLDPENMIWWMNYHQNTDHPHMHVCFLEKIHTRSKGKFTPNQLKEFKRLIIKELTARDTISELTGSSFDEVFKKKDAERNALLERIRSINIEGIDSIVKLATVLPKRGRLQYNSVNLGAYRKQIDEITESFLKMPEIKPAFDLYMESLDLFDQAMNVGAGTAVATLKDRELKKLYSNIGNIILRTIRANNESLAGKREIGMVRERNLNRSVTDSILKYLTKKTPGAVRGSSVGTEVAGYLDNEDEIRITPANRTEAEIDAYLKGKKAPIRRTR